MAQALLAVLAVLIFAYWHQDTSEPLEAFWACLGAAGAIYGASVWWRRLDFQQWWRGRGKNGLMALTIRGHVVLRGVGTLGQLLILASGLSAMATPPSVRVELQVNDLIVTLCLIGLALLNTFSCWFAEQIAEHQYDYLLKHPGEH